MCEITRLRKLHTVAEGTVNLLFFGVTALLAACVVDPAADGAPRSPGVLSLDTPLIALPAEWPSGYEVVEAWNQVPSVSESLIGLPPEALEQLVAGQVLVDFRVTKSTEGAESIVSAIVLSSQQVERQVTEGQLNQRRVFAQELAPLEGDDGDSGIGHEVVTDDDGMTLYYVRFSPTVDPDAPSRVDWAEPGARLDPVVAVSLAENERQLELAALSVINAHAILHETPCRWEGRSRSANSAYVWCPSENDGDLFDALQAVDIEEVAPVAAAVVALNGQQTRSATGLQHGHMIAAGFDGSLPRPSSGRARFEVAILDQDGFHKPWQHPAYDDGAPGSSSRVIRRRTCGSSSCSTHTGSDMGPPLAHGERVMGAFADLLDGQVPGFTTAAREARTYGAPEAHIELYRTLGSVGSYATAIADAVLSHNGVDFISISAAAGACGAANSMPDIRDAWDLAYSHGVVGFLSAGNFVNRMNDNCTVNGMATRADLVIIGASGDDVRNPDPAWLPGRFNTPIWNWVADTQPLMGWHWTSMVSADNCANNPPGGTGCWSSAIGGGSLKTTSGTVANAWTIVDLIAPAGRELSAMANTSSVPDYQTSCCGTSQATPEAASVAVGLVDWARDSGYSIFNLPGIVHVNLLLWGDGTRGAAFPPNPLDHNAGGAPLTSYSGKNRLWGAGRIKARLFNDAGLDGPWAWGTSFFDLGDGQVIDAVIGGTPIDTDVDFFRVAMAWDEPYVDSSGSGTAADIIMRVVVTNPVGGVCVNPNGIGGTVVSSELSFDIEKIITIRPDRMTQLHGKCAWMRFEGLSIPNNKQGLKVRRVYRADFWEDLDREPVENLTDID